LGRIGESAIAPERGGRDAGRLQVRSILVVPHRSAGDGEAVDPDTMTGALPGQTLLPAHPELARRYLNQDHGSSIIPAVRIADRMNRLGTESAFEVLARARALEREGREIIHLEIGEPDFDTPLHIREAAKQALDAGATHYGPSAGLPELRGAIAKHIAETRGVPVSPEEVVVTPGAKPIMFFTILALANAGDEVIYPNPGFPIYESVINFAAAVPVPIPLREANGFGFDLDVLERRVSERTRLIIINSPQNPTGGVLERSQIERIAEISRTHAIPVLSDEIYRDFLYEGEFVSIATLPGMRDHTIVLDGFSKAFAMTGWRLGYGVMPVPLAEHLTRLMVNSASCTASFVQLAGVAALEGDRSPVARMVAEFKRRRDVLVDGLNGIPGVSCVRPRGAFYAFPNVTAIGRKSGEIADLLLQDAGVAVLSGTAFGEYGEGYLRLSYANSEENLRKALDRIAPVLARLQR
jgi:aspartate aminotransferase